jgi:hypothetical protein
MSTDSILESWMDDNSIAEKQLRRGLKLHEQRERRPRTSFEAMATTIIVSAGISLILGLLFGQYLTRKEWQEKLVALQQKHLLENKPYAVLAEDATTIPDKFVKERLRDLKVGDVAWVPLHFLEIDDNKKMYVKLNVSYSKICHDWNKVRLERKENGFAATIFEPLKQKIHHSNSIRYEFSQGNLMPVVSLEIRKPIIKGPFGKDVNK